MDGGSNILLFLSRNVDFCAFQVVEFGVGFAAEKIAEDAFGPALSFLLGGEGLLLQFSIDTDAFLASDFEGENAIDALCTAFQVEFLMVEVLVCRDEGDGGEFAFVAVDDQSGGSLVVCAEDLHAVVFCGRVEEEAAFVAGEIVDDVVEFIAGKRGIHGTTLSGTDQNGQGSNADHLQHGDHQCGFGLAIPITLLEGELGGL